MMRRIALGISITAIAIGLLLFYQAAAISTRGGEDSPVYSTRRYDPYGTAAIKDLLIERGIQVRSLERLSLEPFDRGVLIQVLPHRQSTVSHSPRRLQTQRLLDWIAAGNVVIQFTREPTDLMQACKITGDSPATEALQATHEFETMGKPPAQTPAIVRQAVWDTHNGTPAPRDQRLLLWSPMSLTPPQEGDWHTLARLDGTAPEVLGGSPEIVAGEYRIGQGKLIVVGSPTPILNGMLTQGGNLHFVLALISGNPVILDEWSHGIGHEATVIGFIRRVGLLPVLLQVLVIVILYVWSTSGFARQEDAPGQRQRSCIEQIETLGYLYSQSLDPEVTFERVYAEIQHRLAETLRCQPQEIADSLKLLDPSAKQKVEQLLERINRIGRAHGPRCRTCGYDLTLNTTGRCPECGSMVLPELQQRIREAAAVSVLPERTTRRRVRVDSDLAAILTQSHQLVQEVERDRRALR